MRLTANWESPGHQNTAAGERFKLPAFDRCLASAPGRPGCARLGSGSAVGSARAGREVFPGALARAAGEAVRARRAVPAHDRRHRPRPQGRAAARSARAGREARTDLTRPVGPRTGLLPRLSGQSPQSRAAATSGSSTTGTTAGRRAIYAHVATDPSDPGKLAVEYWFYYTFNDFTDKHESDWEMAQVDFAASTAARGASSGPVRGRPVPARGRGAVSVDRHQAPEGRHAPGHLRRHRLARQLLRARALPRARRPRGIWLRRHSQRYGAAALQDRSAAGRPVLRLGPLRVARFPRTLGPEGERHQQRPDRSRGQGAVAGPDRVGGRFARDEHRGPERHGVRSERGQLLLRRRERRRDRVELVADPSGAVHRACPSVAGGSARGRGHDNVAAAGSPSVATAAPGRSDLPGDDAHLRREHPDIRGGGRDLRSRVRRGGCDPVGGLPSHGRRAARGARRPARCGHGVSRRSSSEASGACLRP